MLVAELIGFVVYVLQQLGIVLAVGAEGILLVLYLVGLHSKEAHPSHTRLIFTEHAGLALILLSGAAAVVLHYMDAQFAVLSQPAFIFKWILIAAAVGWSVVYAKKSLGRGWTAHLTRGAAGSLWYALFLVHTVAPVIGWMYLLLAYVGWTALFVGGWSAFVYAMEYSMQPARVAVPKPAASAPVVVKKEIPTAAPIVKKEEPVIAKVVEVKKAAQAPLAPHPLPAVVFAELEAPHPHVAPAPKPPVALHTAAGAPTPPLPVKAATASAPKPPAVQSVAEVADDDALPAIRVMPRSAEELAGESRASVVQFS